MANEENLKSWSKGQSGNPAGRPKGSRNRSTIVREWLEVKAADGNGDVADQLVRALINRANEGDVMAFRELFDSAFGKNTDKMQNVITYNQMGRVTTSNGEALTFDIGSPAEDNS